MRVSFVGLRRGVLVGGIQSPGMRRKTMEELERGGRHGGSLEMKLLYTTPEYFEYSEQLLRHLESLEKEVGSA